MVMLLLPLLQLNKVLVKEVKLLLERFLTEILYNFLKMCLEILYNHQLHHHLLLLRHRHHHLQ